MLLLVFNLERNTQKTYTHKCSHTFFKLFFFIKVYFTLIAIIIVKKRDEQRARC